MKKSASFLNSKVWYAISTMLLVFVFALCIGTFARAEETITVTVKGANIRKEASTESDVVGNVKQDSVLTVLEQKNGADGKVWYKIQVDANTTGYIRSDLVKAGGTVTATPKPTATPAPTNPGNTTVDTTGVKEVQPVGGTVKGAETVRVRSAADTSNSDNVVASVKRGTVVTVKGTITASNNKVWYLINYVENNKEVNGFIRSDYVDLSGELKDPVVETPVVDDPVDPVDRVEPEINEKPQGKSKYEVWYDDNDSKWILVNNDEMKSWDVEQIFYAATENGRLYQLEQKKTNSQKVIIIVLGVLLLGMIGALAFAIYKMREASETAYINQVERETIRRRTADRPQGTRPQGAKPQGTRPQGTRPQGTRPQGAKPQGTRPQGTRPQGAPATHQQNPQEAPVVKPQNIQEAPVAQEHKTQETVKTINPSEASEATRVVNPEVKPVQPVEPKVDIMPEVSHKPKNFAQDDDEFEFEFLNWNGDDEK